MDTQASRRPSPAVRQIVPRLLLVLAVLGALAWMIAHRGALTPAAMSARLAGLGAWAPVLFVIAYAVGSVLLFPAALFSLAGGAAFGPVLGALLDVIGATLGAAAAFLVARYVAAGFITRLLQGRLGRAIEGAGAQGWRLVVVLRLIPVIPFSVLNYAFGLTGVRFAPYIVATAASLVPSSIAFTWLGYAGSEAAAGDVAAIRWGLLALGVLVLGAFLPRMLRRARARRRRP